MLLLSSCAVHNPMSEMVMFQKKVERDGTVRYAGYGHAFVGTSIDKYPISGVTDYLNRKNGRTNEYEHMKVSSLTTHAMIMDRSNRNFALSIALGFPLGLDLTTKLTHSLYATGSVGLSWYKPFNWQFILQRRLLDGNPTGLSIGAMVVSNHFSYSAERLPDEDSCKYCKSPYISTTSVGVRGVLVMRMEPQYETTDRVFFYANAAYMYDTTMKLWYPKVGFSIGFY